MTIEINQSDVQVKKFWFIVPLKAKSVSKNWEQVCNKLEKTLSSILKQTNSSFGVIVAYNDMPILSQYITDKVKFIKVDYPALTKDSTRWQKEADKLCKQAIALREVADESIEYYMFVDADDYVSSTIVDETFSTKPATGIMLKSGIILDEKSQRAWKVSRFNDLCGTSTIFRFKKEIISQLPDEIKLDTSNEDFMPSFIGKIFSLDQHNQHEKYAKEHDLQFDEWHEPHAVYLWGYGDQTNDSGVFHLSLGKKIRHYLPAFFSKGKRWQPVRFDNRLREKFNLF